MERDEWDNPVAPASRSSRDGTSRGMARPVARSGGRPPMRPFARRWLPAGAAAAVLVAAVAASTSSGAGGNSGDATPKATSPATVVDDTFDPGVDDLPVTQPPAVIVTTPAKEKTRLTRTLRVGSKGPQVSALQNRLHEMGFWPTPDGKPTGQFGPLTRMAVWAYEKLVLGTPSTKVKGVVTNAIWQEMQNDTTIRPRRPNSTPTHLEIYLDLQVAIVFQGQTPAFISHISSGKLNPDGTPATYHETEVIDTNDNGDALAAPIVRYVVGVSKTPIGVFKVSRKIAGHRKSRLGGMLNPVYFNGGIAIHGGFNVPIAPASHGCVRVPNAISQIPNSLLNVGDRVYVFNGIKPPEKATPFEKAMAYDRADPAMNSTVPPTTRAPKPPTTTKPPAPKPPVSTTKPRATTTTTKPRPTTTTKPRSTSTSKPPTTTAPPAGT